MVMEMIEESLIKLLESGEHFSLQDLGGISVCYEAAATIAQSSLMDEFLDVLINDDGITVSENEEEKFKEIVTQCFAKNNDLIAIRNAVELLCTQPERLSFTFDVLINRTADKSAMSIVRGYFLLGAFEIAIRSKSKKYNLISYLVTTNVNDDSSYLKYVSKITGISYSSFQIEDLASKLAEFVVAEVGEDDALYEYGMCFLSKAL